MNMLLAYNEFNRTPVQGDSSEKFSDVASIVESIFQFFYHTEVRIFVWVALLVIILCGVQYAINHSPKGVEENKAQLIKAIVIVAFVLTGGIVWLSTALTNAA